MRRGTAQQPPSERNVLVGYGQINAARAVAGAARPPKTLKAAVPYQGKENLGTPDGSETSLLVVAGVGGLLGVLPLGGGVMLLRRKKPAPAAGPPVPGGPGPGGPGGYGPGGQGPGGPGGYRPPPGGPASPYGGPPGGGPAR
ncbi:MAG: hypothetical protein GEV11_05270 [Streptosporangiales bacterium]|nr:hypothetical protein [Streptosporangiales bacterium]